MTNVDFYYNVNITIALFALLCALCVVLARIDIRSGIIPDWLNLTIGAIGVSKVALLDGYMAVVEALGEAVAVGLIFWLLRRLYFSLRNIQGLGLGDLKFLAAATIWVGIAGIPVLVLAATVSALIFAGVRQLAGTEMRAHTSLPFGPFLAFGLLVSAGLQIV